MSLWQHLGSLWLLFHYWTTAQALLSSYRLFYHYKIYIYCTIISSMHVVHLTLTWLSNHRPFHSRRRLHLPPPSLLPKFFTVTYGPATLPRIDDLLAQALKKHKIFDHGSLNCFQLSSSMLSGAATVQLQWTCWLRSDCVVCDCSGVFTPHCAQMILDCRHYPVISPQT